MDNRQDTAGFRILMSLTSREREVLYLICLPMPSKDIAARLQLSFETINKHVAHIFDKTGMSSRSELIVLFYSHPALQEGILAECG